jgi:3-hydroxymyristoyl/3-hydroxydecanoyl-(acyl carrier protein) dehydratase
VTAVKPSHRGTVKLVRAMKEAIAKESTVIEIDQIMKVLAHRYPFLLVDRILEIEDGKRIVGLEERHDQRAVLSGTFPRPSDHARRADHRGDGAGGRHAPHGARCPNPDQKVVYFTSLNNVKWRRPVKPGDQLRFELELAAGAWNDVQDVRNREGRWSGSLRSGDGRDGEGEMSVETISRNHPRRSSTRRPRSARASRSGAHAIVGREAAKWATGA